MTNSAPQTEEKKGSEVPGSSNKQQVPAGTHLPAIKSEENMKESKAIIIDPAAQSITETDAVMELDALYRQLDCDMIEICNVTLHLRDGRQADVTLIVDEEGSLKEIDRFWFIDQPRLMQPFSGKCLITSMSVDENGEEHLHDVTELLSAADVEKILSW